MSKIGDKTYEAWRSMRNRCRPSHKSHARYADRGITVCARWDSFEAFRSDMGDAPKGMTLDRIDNDKGYYKGNCRWATRQEQMDNTSVTMWIEYCGQKRTQTGWAKHLGITQSAISHCRRKNRLTPAQAIARICENRGIQP